eukprot:TRINITY_DN27058_c0_g1_i1.p2 TRINITY_DN27058_c0_g1~~TRINITY_DN27058_c0_g1_i1.p2  ORF type:complete len:100 (+),score=24.67 TRINITY_DN27058_c0_g1_i1:353-652(+)
MKGLIAEKLKLTEVFTKTLQEQLVKLFRGVVENFKLVNVEFEGKDLEALAIVLDVNIKLGNQEYSCKNEKIRSPFGALISLSDKTIELYKEKELTFLLF